MAQQQTLSRSAGCCRPTGQRAGAPWLRQQRCTSCVPVMIWVSSSHVKLMGMNVSGRDDLTCLVAVYSYLNYILSVACTASTARCLFACSIYS